MDNPEQWVNGFDVPLTLEQFNIAWTQLKNEEAEIFNELLDYQDSRQNTIAEIREMQQNYNVRLGTSNMTQKRNQNLAKMFHDSKKVNKLSSANLNKMYLWREEIQGMANVAEIIHTGADPQSYNTWIWSRSDEPLRGL